MRRPFKLAIVISVILASGAASAKRRAPKDVAPVTAKGIVYKVPHFGFFHQKEQNGGFVQSWDAKTKKLFNDFVRIKNAKTRGIEGSGLGLATVKRIAGLYHGDAAVSSVADQGSTFTVTLKAPSPEKNPPS